mmetsp:Transcript_48766/g.122128  ORF Transcript_48766/g.122128 Transcript_48766/m.122128 type:complete len:84 (+) Transcript_48766:340-591(+)
MGRQTTTSSHRLDHMTCIASTSKQPMTNTCTTHTPTRMSFINPILWAWNTKHHNTTRNTPKNDTSRDRKQQKETMKALADTAD